MITDPDIEQYAQDHTTAEAEHLSEVAAETRRLSQASGMMVGPLEGGFLAALVGISGASRILEIGTFTGYSAITMAAALPPDGHIDTCEVSEEHAAISRRHIEASPHADRIELHLGPAIETIGRLDGPFDMVFIDADKSSYDAYYEAVLPKLAESGFIAFDNVLWSGRVLDDSASDKDTTALRKLNDKLRDDERVEVVMVPIRDGVTIVRPAPTVITVLAGGVGAARYLTGLLRVVDPSSVTAIVNTGDDVTLHGLRVCPDLDTVTYTLAGAGNRDTGWGLAGETWQAMVMLAHYDPSRAWFSLGDRDLGTHLYRTARLAEGATLTDVTGEIARAWGLELAIVPMSDDPVATMVTAVGLGEIGFQDYFVGHRHDVAVSSVRFAGIEGARPAPGVLGAISAADRVVIAPSNPIVSIGPVVALAGVREALTARRETTVAVSPIVAGTALKGPADRMLRELGHEASVVGVARLYAEVAAALVVDEADAPLAPQVEAAGMRCIVAPTVMHGPEEAAALAKVTLA